MSASSPASTIISDWLKRKKVIRTANCRWRPVGNLYGHRVKYPLQSINTGWNGSIQKCSLLLPLSLFFSYNIAIFNTINMLAYHLFICLEQDNDSHPFINPHVIFDLMMLFKCKNCLIEIHGWVKRAAEITAQKQSQTRCWGCATRMSTTNESLTNVLRMCISSYVQVCNRSRACIPFIFHKHELVMDVRICRSNKAGV